MARNIRFAVRGPLNMQNEEIINVDGVRNTGDVNIDASGTVNTGTPQERPARVNIQAPTTFQDDVTFMGTTDLSDTSIMGLVVDISSADTFTVRPGDFIHSSSTAWYWKPSADTSNDSVVVTADSDGNLSFTVPTTWIQIGDGSGIGSVTIANVAGLQAALDAKVNLPTANIPTERSVIQIIAVDPDDLSQGYTATYTTVASLTGGVSQAQFIDTAITEWSATATYNANDVVWAQQGSNIRMFIATGDITVGSDPRVANSDSDWNEVFANRVDLNLVTDNVWRSVITNHSTNGIGVGSQELSTNAHFLLNASTDEIAVTSNVDPNAAAANATIIGEGELELKLAATSDRAASSIDVRAAIENLESHPFGITRIEDASDWPTIMLESYDATDYWTATRRGQVFLSDYGVRFVVGGRHLYVNNRSADFTDINNGDIFSVRENFIDADDPGNEVARFRIGNVRGRSLRADALTDDTVTWLFARRNTGESTASTYIFDQTSERDAIFTGWHLVTPGHSENRIITQEANGNVGTRSIGSGGTGNIATIGNLGSVISTSPEITERSFSDDLLVADNSDSNSQKRIKLNNLLGAQTIEYRRGTAGNVTLANFISEWNAGNAINTFFLGDSAPNNIGTTETPGIRNGDILRLVDTNTGGTPDDILGVYRYFGPNSRFIDSSSSSVDLEASNFQLFGGEDTDTRTDFVVGTTRLDDVTQLTVQTGNALELSGTAAAATLIIPTNAPTPAANVTDIHGDYSLPFESGETFNVFFTVSHTTVTLDVQIAGIPVHGNPQEYAVGNHVVNVTISAPEFATLRDANALNTEPTIGNATIGRLFVPPTSMSSQVESWAIQGNTDIIPHTKTDHPTQFAAVLRGDHLFNTDTIQAGITGGTQATFTFANSGSITTAENGVIDNINFYATPGGIYRFNRLTRAGAGTTADPFRYSLDTDAYFTATIDTFPNRNTARTETEIDFTPIFISPGLLAITNNTVSKDLTDQDFVIFEHGSEIEIYGRPQVMGPSAERFGNIDPSWLVDAAPAAGDYRIQITQTGTGNDATFASSLVSGGGVTDARLDPVTDVTRGFEGFQDALGGVWDQNMEATSLEAYYQQSNSNRITVYQISSNGLPAGWNNLRVGQILYGFNTTLTSTPTMESDSQFRLRVESVSFNEVELVQVFGDDSITGTPYGSGNFFTYSDANAELLFGQLRLEQEHTHVQDAIVISNEGGILERAVIGANFQIEDVMEGGQVVSHTINTNNPAITIQGVNGVDGSGTFNTNQTTAQTVSLGINPRNAVFSTIPAVIDNRTAIEEIRNNGHIDAIHSSVPFAFTPYPNPSATDPRRFEESAAGTAWGDLHWVHELANGNNVADNGQGPNRGIVNSACFWQPSPNLDSTAGLRRFANEYREGTIQLNGGLAPFNGTFTLSGNRIEQGNTLFNRLEALAGWENHAAAQRGFTWAAGGLLSQEAGQNTPGGGIVGFRDYTGWLVGLNHDRLGRITIHTNEPGITGNDRRLAYQEAIICFAQNNNTDSTLVMNTDACIAVRRVIEWNQSTYTAQGAGITDNWIGDQLGGAADHWEIVNNNFSVSQLFQTDQAFQIFWLNPARGGGINGLTTVQGSIQSAFSLDQATQFTRRGIFLNNPRNNAGTSLGAGTYWTGTPFRSFAEPNSTDFVAGAGANNAARVEDVASGRLYANGANITTDVLNRIKRIETPMSEEFAFDIPGNQFEANQTYTQTVTLGSSADEATLMITLPPAYGGITVTGALVAGTNNQVELTFVAGNLFSPQQIAVAADRITIAYTSVAGWDGVGNFDATDPINQHSVIGTAYRHANPTENFNEIITKTSDAQVTVARQLFGANNIGIDYLNVMFNALGDHDIVAGNPFTITEIYDEALNPASRLGESLREVGYTRNEAKYPLPIDNTWLNDTVITDNDFTLDASNNVTSVNIGGTVRNFAGGSGAVDSVIVTNNPASSTQTGGITQTPTDGTGDVRINIADFSPGNPTTQSTPGLVPALPSQAARGNYLRGDGTWQSLGQATGVPQFVFPRSNGTDFITSVIRQNSVSVNTGATDFTIAVGGTGQPSAAIGSTEDSLTLTGLTQRAYVIGDVFLTITNVQTGRGLTEGIYIATNNETQTGILTSTVTYNNIRPVTINADTGDVTYRDALGPTELSDGGVVFTIQVQTVPNEDTWEEQVTIDTNNTLPTQVGGEDVQVPLDIQFGGDLQVRGNVIFTGSAIHSLGTAGSMDNLITVDRTSGFDARFHGRADSTRGNVVKRTSASDTVDDIILNVHNETTTTPQLFSTNLHNADRIILQAGGGGVTTEYYGNVVDTNSNVRVNIDPAAGEHHFVGDLSGNVTGNVVGNLRGDLLASVETTSGMGDFATVLDTGTMADGSDATFTGNAATATNATTLATAREFQVSGDVTTTTVQPFDGSGNVNIPITLNNDTVDIPNLDTPGGDGGVGNILTQSDDGSGGAQLAWLKREDLFTAGAGISLGGGSITSTISDRDGSRDHIDPSALTTGTAAPTGVTAGQVLTATATQSGAPMTLAWQDAGGDQFSSAVTAQMTGSPLTTFDSFSFGTNTAANPAPNVTLTVNTGLSWAVGQEIAFGATGTSVSLGTTMDITAGGFVISYTGSTIEVGPTANGNYALIQGATGGYTGFTINDIFLRGAQGPQGPQGDAGPTGPAGMDGVQGGAGPQGETGLRGNQLFYLYQIVDGDATVVNRPAKPSDTDFSTLDGTTLTTMPAGTPWSVTFPGFEDGRTTWVTQALFQFTTNNNGGEGALLNPPGDDNVWTDAFPAAAQGPPGLTGATGMNGRDPVLEENFETTATRNRFGVSTSGLNVFGASSAQGQVIQPTFALFGTDRVTDSDLGVGAFVIIDGVDTDPNSNTRGSVVFRLFGRIDGVFDNNISTIPDSTGGIRITIEDVTIGADITGQSSEFIAWRVGLSGPQGPQGVRGPDGMNGSDADIGELFMGRTSTRPNRIDDTFLGNKVDRFLGSPVTTGFTSPQTLGGVSSTVSAFTTGPRTWYFYSGIQFDGTSTFSAGGGLWVTDIDLTGTTSSDLSSVTDFATLIIENLIG